MGGGRNRDEMAFSWRTGRKRCGKKLLVLSDDMSVKLLSRVILWVRDLHRHRRAFVGVL
jgi:hypothetical protein